MKAMERHRERERQIFQEQYQDIMNWFDTSKGNAKESMSTYVNICQHSLMKSRQWVGVRVGKGSSRPTLE